MNLSKLNLLARGTAWKQFIQSALRRIDYRMTRLEGELEGQKAASDAPTKSNSELARLRIEQKAFAAELEQLKRRSAALTEMLSAVLPLLLELRPDDLLRADEPVYFVRRREKVRLVQLCPGANPPSWLGGGDLLELLLLVATGEATAIEAARLDAQGKLSPWIPQPHFVEQISARLTRYSDALTALELPVHKARSITSSETASGFFDAAVKVVKTYPDLIDFIARGQAAQLPTLAGTSTGLPPPFDDPDELPAFTVPAAPRRRSALFLHHSYYHFNQLAAGLRRRGWDALTVSITPPSAPERKLYVGEDVSLYHDDPEVRRRQVREFLRTVPERFEALHFYGQGLPSMFHENFESTEKRTKVPWDLLELRRHRVVIGYAPSGCLDGARQSSIRKISQNACARCVWELRPDVCNDAKNMAWARTLETVCDWVGLEGDWAVDDRLGPRFVRGPVTTALDVEFWSPNLVVEDAKRVERLQGEILVYHAVANIENRRANGRDIKGSGAVEDAIARLQAEGIPVRLFFAKSIPIWEVPFYKVQADIVVDQLNYGRIGANARESFMMGKPVITRLMPEQSPPLPPLRSVVEAPALNATERTVLDVLRTLALDRSKREELSAKSRQYALRWFAADVCARRYEMVIDRVKAGLAPETDELYPPPV